MKIPDKNDLTIGIISSFSFLLTIYLVGAFGSLNPNIFTWDLLTDQKGYQMERGGILLTSIIIFIIATFWSQFDD